MGMVQTTVELPANLMDEVLVILSTAGHGTYFAISEDQQHAVQLLMAQLRGSQSRHRADEATLAQLERDLQPAAPLQPVPVPAA